MPCCVAINCSNRSEQGYKLFRFPEGSRGVTWVENVRRGDKWAPTETSRLCEKHFEDSQFEARRADGWKKLKPNAIPTLFDVPNPPSIINPLPRKSLCKNRNNNIAPVPSKATVNEFVPAVEHNYSIRPQETRNEASNSRSIDETLAVHSKTAEPIIFQQPNLVNAENTIHNMIGQELNPEPVQVDVSIIPESEVIQELFIDYVCCYMVVKKYNK
nr:PREDICTED: THAP domain-containing protein 5-like [Linepithema humile]